MLLAGNRILTLVGPGGTGKTRLALALAGLVKSNGGLPRSRLYVGVRVGARSRARRHRGKPGHRSPGRCPGAGPGEGSPGPGAQPAHPGQSRAPRRSGSLHQRAADGVSGPPHRRHEPDRPGHRRRAPRPRGPAPHPGSARGDRRRASWCDRIGGAVRGAGPGDGPGVRAHRGHREARGRDLPQARWPAARHRAGSGADPAPHPGRRARQARPHPALADRRFDRRARPSAHASRHDPMEPRPAWGTSRQRSSPASACSWVVSRRRRRRRSPRDGADPDGSLFDALGALVDHSLLRVAPDTEGQPRFSMLQSIREFAGRTPHRPEGGPSTPRAPTSRRSRRTSGHGHEDPVSRFGPLDSHRTSTTCAPRSRGRAIRVRPP